MYQKEGETQIFRVVWPGRGIGFVGLFGLLVLLFTVGLFVVRDVTMLLLLVASCIAFWVSVKPFIQKTVVLQIEPEGISSHYLRGRTIGWDELLDIKVSTVPLDKYNYPYKLGALLILKEDAPSWPAIQRQWIFWRKNGIRISFGLLSDKEQFQATLALLVAFAQHFDEHVAQFMQEHQDKMEQALTDLIRKKGIPLIGRDIEVPEILERAGFSFSHSGDLV
ncbi:MAG: hypothetical protein LBB65_07790 [Burkholderiales bacterium]|jgi:hypothetical protein|nr:hypothetical protein [Burkholderiales bacterium]